MKTKKGRPFLITISALIIITLIATILLKPSIFTENETHRRYDKIILEASHRHNLPPELIKAVIRKESSFRFQARGEHNEFGLMQFRLAAVQDWRRSTKRQEFPSTAVLLTPEINIEIGSWYLAKAARDWRNYKDWKVLALAQYNAGRGTIHKHGWAPKDPQERAFENINYEMTKSYISDILKYEQFYSKQFQKNRRQP